VKNRLPNPDTARQFLVGFEHVEGEGLQYYLNTAVDRILTTMELLPDLGPDSLALELAAQPYLMTGLLHRYLPSRIHVANEGDFSGGIDGEIELVHRDMPNPIRFSYEKFNLEFDDYPYPDETYDLVMLCETIEHLAWDPVHTLHEVNRILKPGGHFVVSTPNAFRLENFKKILQWKNFYPPYSGWSWTSRHNREFVPYELKNLFEVNGYEVEEIQTRYDPGYDYSRWLKVIGRLLDSAPVARGVLDVIHMRARKTGDPRYSYPDDIFADRYAYSRINSSVIDMSDAPESQLTSGFYLREVWPPCVRWTNGHASATLKCDGHATLNVKFYSGEGMNGRVRGEIITGDTNTRFDVESASWNTVSHSLPSHTTDSVEVKFINEYVPTAGIHDSRPLGLAISRIWLE